jgi:hypothetical protein
MARKRGLFGKIFLVVLLLLIGSGVLIYSLWWFHHPRPGHVKDEALLAGRDAASFHAADEDWFHNMDGGVDLVALGKKEFPNDPNIFVRGRDTWVVWSGGNDRLWDKLVYKSFGALDFLKLISSHPALLKIDPRFSRDKRWEYLGLVNDPCFEKATGPDPQRWNLWLDKRRADCEADPFENEEKYPGVRYGARGKVTGPDGKTQIGSFYGYETGIVGLRLFPNPDFDEAAAKKWDAAKYYTDKNYSEDKDLIRPYRVGMSCGFCHIGPNPVKPPADPDNPKWENLSSNVGAQYYWTDRNFFWEADKSNFLWQLLHTYRPGTLDTSLVSTDNIVNPRTMNAVYLLKERLELSKRWGREKLAGGELNNKQFNEYIPNDSRNPYEYLNHYFEPTDTVWTPHVLKDGSDSVGGLGALNRVYLNIGTFSEEWLLHFNALVGGKPITPIQISVSRKNSAYFAATEAQTPATALYFLNTTEAHHLADAPGGKEYLKKDEDKVQRGKEVFAERCARCHSSKLPTPPVAGLDPVGCAGKDYLNCWNNYWQWTKTDDYKTKMKAIVMAPDFLEHNYLSTEVRVPVTLLQTNACSPLATNALAGNIWNDFSSQSYKELPSVGEITWYHPYSGEAKTYKMPAGGRGYTRPPSLVSLWSTAPFLLNNSVGRFEESPSVEARLRSFEDSIQQMLWPEKRDKDEELGDRIPGKIDRTTQTSYLRITNGYLPDALDSLRGPLSRFFPWLFNDQGSIELGPIPKGTPIGLLGNVNPLSESDNPAERLEHDRKLLSVVLKIKKALKSLPDNATDEQAKKAFAGVVDPLLDLSKCPDLIVNRGHYFGTDKFAEEPGLSDADKWALIAFLKRF